VRRAAIVILAALAFPATAVAGYVGMSDANSIMHRHTRARASVLDAERSSINCRRVRSSLVRCTGYLWNVHYFGFDNPPDCRFPATVTADRSYVYLHPGRLTCGY